MKIDGYIVIALLAILFIALSFVKIYRVDSITVMYQCPDNTVDYMSINYRYYDDWTNINKLEKFIASENNEKNVRVLCLKVDRSRWAVRRDK